MGGSGGGVNNMRMRRASMNQGVHTNVVHTVDESVGNRHESIDTNVDTAVPSEENEGGDEAGNTSANLNPNITHSNDIGGRGDASRGGGDEAGNTSVTQSVIEKVGLRSYLYRENDNFDVKRDDESNRFIRNTVLLAKGKISFYDPPPNGETRTKSSKKIYPKGNLLSHPCIGRCSLLLH